jgi:hypothetical protein
MALVWFTDKVNNTKVAINPAQVVAIFTAAEGDLQGTTIISLINGTIPVGETDLEVVTALNGV